MTRWALLLIVLLPTAAAAQSESFIVQLGTDTIAMETFVRQGTRLEGRLAGAALPVAVHYVYQHDSLYIELTRAGSEPAARSFAVPANSYPFINLSFALVESAIMKTGGDTVAFFIPDNGAIMKAVLTRVGADSAILSLGGVALRLQLDARGRILHGAVPAQNVTIERVAGTLQRGAAAPPDYSAPADAAYTAEHVVVRSSEGHSLAGTLTLPKARAGRIPAVITISGSGAQERDEVLPGVRGYRPFRELAEALAARGVAMLRYDDRGFGASTGVYNTATSQDFANDTRAMVAYLRSRPEIDADRIFLVGHSEGGLIAPLVAAEDPRLAGIALLAGPAYTGRRIVAYQNRNAIEQLPGRTPAQRDSLYAVAVASLDSIAAQQPWFRFFLEHDPLPVIASVRQPVLIVHGQTDRQVTAEQAGLLADALRKAGNNRVAVHVLPEVNHLFLADPVGNVAGYSSLPTRTLVPQLLRIVTDWIVNTAEVIE